MVIIKKIFFLLLLVYIYYKFFAYFFRESILEEQKTSGTQLLKQHSSPHVEYKCSYCNFVANTRFEVQRHSNDTHELNVNDFATMELPPKTPKNMYKCFKCPKEFKKRQPYILHLTVHFRVKPYKVLSFGLYLLYLYFLGT